MDNTCRHIAQIAGMVFPGSVKFECAREFFAHLPALQRGKILDTPGWHGT